MRPRTPLAALLVALAVAGCAPDPGPDLSESPARRVFRGPTSTVAPDAPTTVATFPAATVATTAAPAPTATSAPAGDPRVFLLGDSVLEALGPAYTDQARRVLEPLGWQVTMDTAVSRSSIAALDVLAARRAEVGGAAVIHVGHNDGNRERYRQKVTAMLDLLAGVPEVVLVTLQEKTATQARLNEVLRAAAAARPGQVVLVDWADLARQLPGANAKDGLHLSPTGAEALARLIAAALGPAPAAG